ncbi:hypothetical protein Ao3042_09494 [Aspergillus oryzae 3.042]|uniref:Uncharacterized protein n=1 Tax=Aspergillus oryzae (strain 3.042) TaxID=1160506 RepID=I8TKF8_ASPO3|nr:hypothetical protein Ao3042_09494 [Aspergillus oryzae 3.042]|eukprot:EIT74535.1 hypothetical protein Ao3042_09494 [Aspergillus oryzae 3.042]
MDLQPPSVLAQLPRPLHASKGKTHIGEVYSLSDSKKRKRYEVAVAVDGEAVNIYNLVTSYAVPPQSSFSCEPCSVRRKLSDKSVVKRQTYVAVNPQNEIKCFVEESGGNGSSAPVISSASFSVKDSSTPTVFIGIVPTGSSQVDERNPFDILTVHQDGRVRRLAADLDNQHWSLQHSELAKISSSHAVQACFLVEFEDAKKALFKRRQDLAALALGDLVDSNVDEPSVLLLVSHPTGSKEIKLSDVKVHMFSVPAKTPSQERTFDESQKLKHLLTFSIPDIKGQELFESSGLEWDFHTGSAGLNLSFAKGFVNFDLSQYKPTVTSQFILENEDFSSLMRISPQSVIGAGNSIVALFDTQYKSIQRSISLNDIHESNSSKARTKFISYYAKLGIAVATKGNTLFAFDLSSSNSLLGSSLKRSRDSLLIDAIGRGIGSSASQSVGGTDWSLTCGQPRSQKTAPPSTVPCRRTSRLVALMLCQNSMSIQNTPANGLLNWAIYLSTTSTPTHSQQSPPPSAPPFPEPRSSPWSTTSASPSQQAATHPASPKTPQPQSVPTKPPPPSPSTQSQTSSTSPSTLSAHPAGSPPPPSTTLPPAKWTSSQT